MSAWAPAVTEADLAAAQGFAGNGVCGWVLSLDLEVTARGGEGRGSGRQERGWAGMRKRGRGDRNEEERGGRKEGRSHAGSSWDVLLSPPAQTFKFLTSDLSPPAAAGCIPPRNAPARRARIADAPASHVF